MIAIIDYGAGNIFSVKNALDYLGLESKLVSDKESVKAADAVILPGVGAFPAAMKKLEATGLVDTIKEEAARKPFLGICLGMQMTVIEYARNVCGLAGADSAEFGETPHPVIDIMDEQRNISEKGGTMRLGLYPCKLTEGSKCREIYGEELIYERHRHRYEFNNAYRKILTSNGLMIAGMSPDEKLVEIVELPDHPWFVGVQFHPEFKSRPNKPQKLFADFIRASLLNNA